jgi:PIN domain nuclease of toxin-antitoxin system
MLLWGFADPERLSAIETAAIEAPENLVFVSVASLWEIAIKTRDGRLQAPGDLPERVAANLDFEVLPVLGAHAWAVRQLPILHRDPFDHLLIAQALCEGLTLMTHDRRIKLYEAPIFGR